VATCAASRLAEGSTSAAAPSLLELLISDANALLAAAEEASKASWRWQSGGRHIKVATGDVGNIGKEGTAVGRANTQRCEKRKTALCRSGF